MSAAVEPSPIDPQQVEEACQMARNLANSCGYRVFPCHPDKSPACFGGYKDATCDAEAIARLWHRHPGVLVGVATGETFDSQTGEDVGVDVLDIDVAHEMAVKWFAVARKRIPPTRTFATRRNGHHLYFRHAAGVRNNQSKLAAGVDVRGDGGYVIYWFAAGLECEDHTPPTPWPAWLLECVLWKPPPISLVVTKSFKPEHAEKAIEGALRVITGAKEGQRNSCLHWAACRLKDRSKAGEISAAEANTLLLSAARSVGLLDTEAQRTINSAWRQP